MKRNKKAIVITAIVMFIGVLLVLLGFFGNWFFGLFKKGFDSQNIISADIGRIFLSLMKISIWAIRPHSSSVTLTPVKVRL